MPVLLLARGDKEGRDLLRKALEARYGLGAPAMDTLKIFLQGRARAKLGPISTWVSLNTTVHFGFPDRARWEYDIRALGIPVRAGTNAFEGSTYRKHTGNQLETITDPAVVRAARLRLMTAAAMLLTPIAQEFIELKATGERSFEAVHLETQDAVQVSLHNDYTVDTVSTRCLNPDQNFREQQFTLQALDGQQAVNDLMLPCKIKILWDDDPVYEAVPMSVESNQPLDEGFFRLENP